MRTARQIARSDTMKENGDTNQGAWQANKAPQIAKAKASKQRENKFSVNQEAGDIPLIKRDDQGNVTGVTLPNGDKFEGISPEDVRNIVDDWNNQNAEPANSMYADVYAAKKEEAALLAQKQTEKKALEQNAEKLTPDIGKVDAQEVKTPDMLQGSITQNQESIQFLEGIQSSTGGIVPAKKLSQFANPLINALNSEFFGGSLGTDILNQISFDNPEVRSFIKGYSNKENYDSIKLRISAQKGIMASAITAANKAATVEQQNNALMFYNQALTDLNRLDESLRLIGENDKGAYVKQVLDERTALKSYLEQSIPLMNQNMEIALKLPNPLFGQAQNNGGGINGG